MVQTGVDSLGTDRNSHPRSADYTVRQSCGDLRRIEIIPIHLGTSRGEDTLQSQDSPANTVPGKAVVFIYFGTSMDP